MVCLDGCAVTQVLWEWCPVTFDKQHYRLSLYWLKPIDSH